MMEIKLHDDGMTLLQFIATVLPGLWWPLLIFIVILLFRTQISELAHKLTSFGAGSVVAKFDQAVEIAQSISADNLTKNISEAEKDCPTISPPVSSPESPSRPATTKDSSAESKTFSRAAPKPVLDYQTWLREGEADATAKYPGKTPEEKVLNLFQIQEGIIRGIASKHGIPEDMELKKHHNRARRNGRYKRVVGRFA